MKKVYLIHGWEGNPDNCWFPWLKEKLEDAGFEVFAPAMPNPDEPDIDEWVAKLSEVVDAGEDTILVGHSIGCQTILRYLDSLKQDVKFKGIFFVAGFVNLTPEALEDQGSKEIAEPWLSTPINWENVKRHSDKFVAIFSDNDPFVYVSDSKIFKEKLSAKIIIENNLGHFDDDANIKELPSLLKEIAP